MEGVQKQETDVLKQREKEQKANQRIVDEEEEEEDDQEEYYDIQVGKERKLLNC